MNEPTPPPHALPLGDSLVTPPHRASGARRFAVVSVVGALVGFVLFCVFGPHLIGWWYAPPANEAFSCGPAVVSALGGFVKFQIGAALGGAVLLLVLVGLLRSLWAKLTGQTANRGASIDATNMRTGGYPPPVTPPPAAAPPTDPPAF